MGSAFLLSNFTIDGMIARLPTFQAFNLPHLDVRGEFFIDAARTFDRARVLQQVRLYVDAGVGLQLGTPTHTLHLIYGQSTTDGRRALTAYLEKNW
jgi:outer membrane protein assembly factor BamA